jgi:hypothetical protein
LYDPDGKPVQSVDGSSNPLYQADGVTPIWETTTGVQLTTSTPDISTKTVGIYSTADTGSLLMHDVSMFNGTAYAPIVKVGAAGWSFTNVERHPAIDTVLGPRISHDVQPDAGDIMMHYESDFAGLRFADTDGAVPGGKLDPNHAKAAYVVLTGTNNHLSLATPAATTYNYGFAEGSEFLTEFLVFVQQDATGGRTVKWSADTKPEIVWYGDYLLDDAPNAISIFRFYFHTLTRQWICMRLSKSANAKPVYNETTTVVPTLRHANSHVVITHATGASFQINRSLARFPVGTTFTVEQGGAGPITFSALGGSVITSLGNKTTSAGQYAVCSLVKKSDTDWNLSGDLA